MEAQLTDSEYAAALVPDWARNVSEGCVRELQCVSGEFKFVVNCTIVQKIGAGVCASSAALWDSETDGCLSVRWENEHMIAVVFVVGCALR